jgi:hypothetical protein
LIDAIILECAPNDKSLLGSLVASRTAGAAFVFLPYLEQSSSITTTTSGAALLRLAAGPPNATSGAKTGGYEIRVPDEVELAASGKPIQVSVVARAADRARSARLGVAYSTNDVGNSGWRWFAAGPEWAVFEMEYNVPRMNLGNGDFIGLLPDIPGAPGVEVAAVSLFIKTDIQVLLKKLKTMIEYAEFHWADNRRSPASVFDKLLDDYRFEADPLIQRHLTDKAKDLARGLTSPFSLTFDNFSILAKKSLQNVLDLWTPIRREDRYLRVHMRRFWEIDSIINSLLAMKNRSSAELLDIGFSINSIILSQLFPESHVHVADLAYRCKRLRRTPGISRAFPLDLHSVDQNTSLDLQFDIILFSEVLEHLLANPLKVARFLIRHLSDDGYLVLTTPNFFSRQKLLMMRQRINPQPAFPTGYKVGYSPGFHVREYCMSELLSLIEAAGGIPATFFFSACWDGEPLKPADNDVFDDTRSNLMVIATKDTDRCVDPRTKTKTDAIAIGYHGV